MRSKAESFVVAFDLSGPFKFHLDAAGASFRYLFKHSEDSDTGAPDFGISTRARGFENTA